MQKSNYKSVAEWSNADSKAYQAACIRGLIPKICEEFGWELPKERKPDDYWSIDRCREVALKYKSRSEWAKACPSYSYASKNGWLDECTQHMIRKHRPNGYWTLERCKEDALQFDSTYDWAKHSLSGYATAKNNGWLDECRSHMVVTRRPDGYWTLETCKEDALKYLTKRDWEKYNKSAFSIAVKKGWYKECTSHMLLLQKPNGYWNLTKCKEEALKYKTRTEWMKSNGASYQAAFKKGWVNECTHHMK